MRNKLVSRRALNLRANGRAQNLTQIYFLDGSFRDSLLLTKFRLSNSGHELQLAIE